MLTTVFGSHRANTTSSMLGLLIIHFAIFDVRRMLASECATYTLFQTSQPCPCGIVALPSPSMSRPAICRLGILGLPAGSITTSSSNFQVINLGGIAPFSFALHYILTPSRFSVRRTRLHSYTLGEFDCLVIQCVKCGLLPARAGR